MEPGRTLTWSLVSGPAGLTVSPGGLITWTPDESQGPSTNSVTIQATDNGTPPRSATHTFNLTVKEVNRPPLLGPIASTTVNAGTLLSFTLSATDPDLPANNLTFALVDPPAGATINRTNGLFSWTPTQAQGPGSYVLHVAVSDDGTPSLSATQSFSVFVNATENCPTTVAGDRPGLSGTTVQMAYDGNLSTYFHSSYIDWQSITIDRGCVGLFSGLRRYMSRSGSTSGVRQTQGESVLYSVDGVNWTRMTASNSHGWENYVDYVAVPYGWPAWLELNQPALARYVTYAWDGDNDWLHEIELGFNTLLPTDLTLTQTVSPAIAAIGQPVTFTLSVTNAGHGTAFNVKVNNPLPAEATFLSATVSRGTYAFTNGVVTCTRANCPPQPMPSSNSPSPTQARTPLRIW